jgi:hypothetical protein
MLLAILMTACASAAPSVQSVPNIPAGLGQAPELSGEVWLNTDTPLRQEDLLGKVVLVDMWTFG